MNNESEKLVKIVNCARCGKDHDELIFKQFAQNPIEDSDGTIWNYWAMCPDTKEPILLKIVERQ